FVLVFLGIWAWFVARSFSRKSKPGKLPPGPTPLPVIGNMLQLGTQPHRSLRQLSKKFGPIMSLRLGKVFTVVVSSPEYAREVLQKHDQNFSSRIVASAARAHGHDKLSMAYIPIGDAWRKIRKLCKEQMFSNFRLDASQHLREARLKKLREYVERCRVEGRAVDLGEAAFLTTLNLMSTTFFSMEFAEFGSEKSGEFRSVIEGVSKIVGVPNFADYFPILQPLDPQGICKEANVLFGKLLDLIGNLLKQRLEERAQSSPSRTKKADLLEALIDLCEQDGGEYSMTHTDITHLLLDLFVAGSDTTASTTEWTMTELLRNPEKLEKAQKEMRSVIGLENQVHESDLSKLPYFQAMIKEVFRYHPPGINNEYPINPQLIFSSFACPLLIPHKADADVEIGGYTVPKGTQMLVNVWAIGRDENVWPNPESFEPERFLGSKVDFKGQYFELLPFGSGRRLCPGMPLATRMLPITVAALIHNFDWKLEDGANPKSIDTVERFGLSLRKAVPIRAIPSK
ncbi:hypothetical protein M569_08252, partial [Genlisea aurea]